jgi:hypothetical protein
MIDGVHFGEHVCVVALGIVRGSRSRPAPLIWVISVAGWQA